MSKTLITDRSGGNLPSQQHFLKSLEIVTIITDMVGNRPYSERTETLCLRSSESVSQWKPSASRRRLPEGVVNHDAN